MLLVRLAGLMTPSVLYEDNHCLAVCKPAGLLTQGVPAGLPTLEAWAKQYLKERHAKRGNVYLGIPHRLDRPVSGVVLFARNTKAARRLAEQFQSRQVEKMYWAAAEGNVEPAAGAWEDWLLKLPEEARVVPAAEGAPGVRRAVLRYRRLAEGPGITLLEIRPETGRTHQIRVQAAVRGWPLLGDALYGARRPFGVLDLGPRERPIALHARALTFLHPVRYGPVTVVAPLPVDWASLPVPRATGGGR